MKKQITLSSDTTCIVAKIDPRFLGNAQALPSGKTSIFSIYGRPSQNKFEIIKSIERRIKKFDDEAVLNFNGGSTQAFTCSYELNFKEGQKATFTSYDRKLRKWVDTNIQLKRASFYETKDNIYLTSASFINLETTEEGTL